MKKRNIYAISLLCVGVLSIYPIYMGISVLYYYLTQGGVDLREYPQYIIPYTPICLSLLMLTLLMPIIRKIFKKYSLLVSSLISTALFFILELFFEKVTVFDSSYGTPMESNVEYWQMATCRAYDPLFDIEKSHTLLADYSPAFKIHFYVISLVLILAVINLITEFYKIYADGAIERKRPFRVQLAVTIVFIALCILACFTAFFRDGSIHVSFISAVLMTLFFVVMGVTVGIYLGCVFYQKNKLLSLAIPSISALLITFIMYIGELILLGGRLYVFGNSFFFQPLLNIPFSIFDIFTIILSGLCNYIILKKLLS